MKPTTFIHFTNVIAWFVFFSVAVGSMFLIQYDYTKYAWMIAIGAYFVNVAITTIVVFPSRFDKNMRRRSRIRRLQRHI